MKAVAVAASLERIALERVAEIRRHDRRMKALDKAVADVQAHCPHGHQQVNEATGDVYCLICGATIT